MRLLNPISLLPSFVILSRYVLPAKAVDLDPTQPNSIRDAAKKVAADLVGMYANVDDGTIVSGIPGLLTYPPYYWWEAGAMFGQLIDYWYYTNDSTFNDLVRAGMIHQLGDNGNLMPSNQSKDEGNDDQLFWAFSVMSATELNFPDPPEGTPGWLAVAQSVFNQLVSRWSTAECNGGLRWQIYQWLDGYNYKNMASNGGMFQLGARLAKYTGNDTYAKYAEMAFDWLIQSPLLTTDWQVYDGTDVLKGCKDADQMQWTYNYGIIVGGAAYMYNYTNANQTWADRLTGFLTHTERLFFPQDQNGVMVEVACEIHQTCDIDQWSFKAYLSRWLAVCAQIAPYTQAQILPLLQKSAVAAARQCDGGSSGAECGSRWFMNTSDGNSGVGQQMSALSVIAANMITEVQAPYTEDTGGTSKGNPAAGTGSDAPETPAFDTITTADKAGAGILTAIVLGSMLGGGYWMIT
ncbi:putative cell wall glycosyl hydrolase Dfg5 [Lojkania enalia]|uniref:Mannan endo-1,6-alpha-mannosidase n=1 Tax=Lojkania enalia TaxID=147567 RepID=A0A9P4KA95_9PLEO|nr:putative cell wall glycosyl hydrolase Dfg5 [Didymosphaeria enalia]